ncbi:hypothetical protein AAY473_008272 [Plecturocebus cupreus]
MGSHYVAQAGLKLLGSSHPITIATQTNWLGLFAKGLAVGEREHDFGNFTYHFEMGPQKFGNPDANRGKAVGATCYTGLTGRSSSLPSVALGVGTEVPQSLLPALKPVRGSGPATRFMRDIRVWGQEQWLMPVILTFWEAKARASLEARSLRPSWAKQQDQSTKSFKKLSRQVVQSSIQLLAEKRPRREWLLSAGKSFGRLCRSLKLSVETVAPLCWQVISAAVSREGTALCSWSRMVLLSLCPLCPLAVLCPVLAEPRAFTDLRREEVHADWSMGIPERHHESPLCQRDWKPSSQPFPGLRVGPYRGPNPAPRWEKMLGVQRGQAVGADTPEPTGMGLGGYFLGRRGCRLQRRPGPVPRMAATAAPGSSRPANLEKAGLPLILAAACFLKAGGPVLQPGVQGLGLHMGGQILPMLDSPQEHREARIHGFIWAAVAPPSWVG